MLNRLTEFFVKNNVIATASGFIIAISLNEFISAVVKNIIIPGLLPMKEGGPLFGVLSSLFSLVLVVFIIYVLLGEFAEKTLGVAKVEEREKVKDTITAKIVEKKVEENPHLMNQIANGDH